MAEIVACLIVAGSVIVLVVIAAIVIVVSLDVALRAWARGGHR